QFDPDPAALSAALTEVCGATPQERARQADAVSAERYTRQYARLMAYQRRSGRSLFADEEALYWNRPSDLRSSADPALERYLQGDISGSARMYWARIRRNPHDCVAKDNLAYILRRETLDPETRALLGEVRLEALLAEGLAQGRAHARLNRALWALAQGDAPAARAQLAALSRADWAALMPWWRDRLWRGRGDPEGALVCLLALARGYPADQDPEALRAAAAAYPLQALGLG
ncbi:MAG: hypothetical protein ACOYJA_10725, partial [Christensenellales bacterium]